MKEPETIAGRIGSTATGWGILVAGALFGAATLAATPEDPFADGRRGDEGTRVEPGVVVDHAEREPDVALPVPPESARAVDVADPPTLRPGD